MATRRGRLGTRLLLLVAISLLSRDLGAQVRPTGSVKKPISSAAPEAMQLLDDDAGIILSLQVSQLQKLSELALDLAPEMRSGIQLAALGASALLGWNPLLDSSWAASGFALDSKILIQAEAIDSAALVANPRHDASSLWRTRVILSAADPQRVRNLLEAIRFREKAMLVPKDDRALAALLGLDPKKASALRAKLHKEGVFLVAKVPALPSRLFVSQRGKLFVFDFLRPYGTSNSAKWQPHEKTLVKLAKRSRSASIANDKAKSDQLRSLFDSAPIAIWVNPKNVANMLIAAELDTLGDQSKGGQDPACGPFGELAQQSHFDNLSLQAHVSSRKLHLDLQWHLRKGSTLPLVLSTQDAPLLPAKKQALHALLRLDALSELRDQKRPPVSQSWDGLWGQAARCHSQAKIFAVATDWPRIVGLFFDELASLHPQSDILLRSLGSTLFSVEKHGKQQALVAEAWLRPPGAPIAKAWLQTLFGNPKESKKATRWGRGLMRPYVIAHSEGHVLGSNLIGPPATDVSLAKRSTRKLRSSPNTLFVLRAKPSKLRLAPMQHSILGRLRSYQGLSANFTLEKDLLRFTIDLQKD